MAQIKAECQPTPVANLSPCPLLVYPYVQTYVASTLTSRAGLAIENKLLSEQPARHRAEHGAVGNAGRLNSVLVRISILSSCISLLLYISGFQIVVLKRVTFIW